MKKVKFILVLSSLIIVTICTLNIQNSFITAKRAGYSSLIDIITLNTAKASIPTPDCNGEDCDDANDNKYNTLTIGNKITCCGAAWMTRGKQES